MEAAIAQEIAARKLDWPAGPAAPAAVEAIYCAGEGVEEAPPEQLDRLLQAIRAAWPADAPPEITLEWTAATLPAPARIQELCAIGLTRLNFVCAQLSLQEMASFLAEQKAAIAGLRQAGLPALDLHLYYGHEQGPRQGLEQLLKAAIAREPDQIMLETPEEPALAFEELERQYNKARQVLADAGYAQQDLVHFARAGSSRFMQTFAARSATLGLGPGAHSYDGHLQSWGNTPDASVYQAQPARAYNGPGGFSETLDEQGAMNEALLVGLRHPDGVATAPIQALCTAQTWKEYKKTLKNFCQEGLAWWQNGRFGFYPAYWLRTEAYALDLMLPESAVGIDDEEDEELLADIRRFMEQEDPEAGDRSSGQERPS
jgi:coproporphyrinogen III oxidase-like Fe-S oxidoreductase